MENNITQDPLQHRTAIQQTCLGTKDPLKIETIALHKTGLPIKCL